MYNLEVAQDHTFVVGMGQWVVHNACFPGENSADVGTPSGFADSTKLNGHFRDHGGDFGATTPQEYEQEAINFLSGTPSADELQLKRTNGDIVRWNKATGEFGVISSSGIIRTYFDISGRADPSAYFLRQYW